MEKAAGQIVSFIVSIVLARLLLPEQYGMIAMVSVFIVIADVFVSTGLSATLVQKKDSDELDFSSNLCLNIALSIFLYAFLFFFAPYIAKFYNIAQLSAVLRVLGIRLLFSSYSAIQQAYISKHMLFRNTAVTTIIATLISAAVGIGMAFFGYGVWALVGQQLSQIIVQVLMLSLTIKWKPGFKFSWIRSKEMFVYGSNILTANLLDTINNQMRSLIIGRFYSDSDLAYYNRGDSYPQMLLSSINNTLHVVLFAAYSKEQDNLSVVKRIVRQGVKLGSFIIFPLMTGLAMIARPLITIMLTEKWIECVPYLRIACFTYSTWIIQIVNQEAIMALGYAGDYLRVTVVRTLFSLGTLMVAMRFGVVAVAISAALSNVFSVIIIIWYSKKHFEYNYLELIKDILPALTISFVMAICVYPLSLIPIPMLLTLVVQVITGAVVYICVSMLTKNESFHWAIQIAKSKFSLK